jgi:hypothetical protein
MQEAKILLSKLKGGTPSPQCVFITHPDFCPLFIETGIGQAVRHPLAVNRPDRTVEFQFNPYLLWD